MPIRPSAKSRARRRAPRHAAATPARHEQPIEAQVYVNLTIVQDQLWNGFVPLLRAHDLTHQQYNVLRVLRGGDARGQACQAIAERLIYRVPDITRLVDRLASRGLVERARIERDRRVVLVRLTAKGAELLARLDRPIADVHRGQLAHLTRRELAELNRLLLKTRAAP
jgi:DNA-binding MarR family transcriptional regulator